MLVREQVIQLLTNNVTPQTMVSVLDDYVFERTGKRLEMKGIQVDPWGMMIIQENYQFALDWYRIKYEIHVLQDKDKQTVLKLF